MPRRPGTSLDQKGNTVAKVILPAELWTLLISVGHQAAQRLTFVRIDSDDQAGQVGLSILMKHVGDLLIDGETDWLPDRDFAKAIATLKGSNFGAIPTPEDKIDVDRLHKSSKLKSGYYGVYVSAQGFRAMGRDFAGKTVVVGTFKTAEIAAHRRMLYHRANNVAYGELEIEMERWRADNAKWGAAGMSDETLIAEIKAHAAGAGTYDAIFGPGSFTIEPVYSSKLPRREQVLAKPTGPKPLTVAEAIETGATYPPLFDGHVVAEEEHNGCPHDCPVCTKTIGAALVALDPSNPPMPPGFDPEDIPPDWK